MTLWGRDPSLKRREGARVREGQAEVEIVRGRGGRPSCQL